MHNADTQKWRAWPSLTMQMVQTTGGCTTDVSNATYLLLPYVSGAVLIWFHVFIALW